MFSLEASGKPPCLAAGHQAQPCENMPSSADSNTQCQIRPKTDPKHPLNHPAKPCLLLRAAAQQHKPPFSSAWMLLQEGPSLRSGQAQHTLQEWGEPSGIKHIPSTPKDASLQCHFNLVFARHSQSKGRFATS